MKRTGIALVLLLVAGVATAAGVNLNTSTRYEFTDCDSGGSSSQSVARGTYLFRVMDADVWICKAATCASGGERFPSGLVMKLSFGTTTSVSCRSANDDGDAIFTDTGEGA